MCCFFFRWVHLRPTSDCELDEQGAAQSYDQHAARLQRAHTKSNLEDDDSEVCEQPIKMKYQNLYKARGRCQGSAVNFSRNAFYQLTFPQRVSVRRYRDAKIKFAPHKKTWLEKLYPKYVYINTRCAPYSKLYVFGHIAFDFFEQSRYKKVNSSKQITCCEVKAKNVTTLCMLIMNEAVLTVLNSRV